MDHNLKNSVQLPLDLKLFFFVSQINLNLLFSPWFADETEPTLFERASQCFDDHNVSHDRSLVNAVGSLVLHMDMLV
jgi:hypothetical protein